METSEIAIYISFGSLAVSSLSFLFSARQVAYSRKSERKRSYDKVYHEACGLLTYHFDKEMEAPFVHEDKDLEKAINEFASAHWLEQLYGLNSWYPEYATSNKEKVDFRQRVSETYYSLQRERTDAWIASFHDHQSPVFHLDNHEFAERYNRVLEHVSQNLSCFSPGINTCWEKIKSTRPDKVKKEYEALKRVNALACEALDEGVPDPFCKLLLLIRYEYRQMTMTFRDRREVFWFNLRMRFVRGVSIFSRKKRDQFFEEN